MKLLPCALKINLFISYNMYFASCFTIDLPPRLKANYLQDCIKGPCDIKTRTDRDTEMLKGMFLSEKEIYALDNTHNAILHTPLDREELHNKNSERIIDDGDVCCPTEIKHTYVEKMFNIHDRMMTIVNLTIDSETMYQYMPLANCSGKGSCQGKCSLENKTITLLGYDENNNYRFDLFNIPGYCSCKNSYDDFKAVKILTT